MPTTTKSKKSKPITGNYSVVYREDQGQVTKHVTKPASATEIRRTYHISKTRVKRVLDRLRSAGVKVD